MFTSLHTLLWQSCLLCKALSPQNVCTQCLQACPVIPFPCGQCGLPLALESSIVCGDCLLNPKPFKHTLCPFAYAAPLDRLLHQYKNSSPALLGGLFAQFLVSLVRANYPPQSMPTAIIPVPCHWQKKWRRGFNPAHYLAELVGKTLDIPVIPAIAQVLPITAQKTLNKQQRLKNVSGAFEVNQRYLKVLKNQHLVVVDDVITTGATVTCLTQRLLNIGAASVDIWAIARTPKPLSL